MFGNLSRPLEISAAAAPASKCTLQDARQAVIHQEPAAHASTMSSRADTMHPVLAA